MVESAGLENQCACKGTGGSNPSPSASYNESTRDEYSVPASAMQFPEGEKALYKLGKVCFDTKHACIVVPTNAPANGKGWVKKEKLAQVMHTINYLKNQMEHYWA